MSGTVHLVIQDLKKVSYDVDVDTNITVAQLKGAIAQKHDVESSGIQIIFHSKILNDSEILSNIGVQDGSKFKIFVSKAKSKSSNEQESKKAEQKPVVNELPKPPIIKDEPQQQSFNETPKYSSYDSPSLNKLPSPLDTPAPEGSSYGMSSDEYSNYYQMFASMFYPDTSKSSSQKFYQSIADTYKNMVDSGKIKETPEGRQAYESLTRALNESGTKNYEQKKTNRNSAAAKFSVQMAKYFKNLYEMGYYSKTPELEKAYRDLCNFIDKYEPGYSTMNQGSFYNEYEYGNIQKPKIEEVPMDKPKPEREPAKNVNAKKPKQDPRELLSKMTSAQQLECNKLYIEGFSMDEAILIYSACDYEYETALAVLKLD